MITSSKRQEHKSCGCATCRRGAGSVAGQFAHRYANRQLRHHYNSELDRVVSGELDPGDFEPVQQSTDYTD